MKRFLQIVVCLIAMTSMARAAAPVISNVLVTATTPTSGTITWTTDIPSTSMLQYGTTPAIPYQTNVNYTLTTTHSMTLPLLTAGPLYYVAAVSGDNAGNNTQSATITFSVCGSPTIPVSGTVNNYYEYGSYTLTWIPPAGTSGTTPTACGAPIQRTITGNLSGSASFTTAVADASKVVPGPGQWQISATDAGNLAPITVTEYLAQSSQDVSPALQLAASTAGLTACIINTISGITYPTDCGGGQLSLEHNGVPLVDQKLLNFNDTTPAPPGGNINVTFQSDGSGNLSAYIPTSGLGGCPQGVCVQNNPSTSINSGNQFVVQPPTTNLFVNNLSGEIWGDQYGTGINGIETAYGQCLAQNGLGYSGCTIKVSPDYTNSDVPSGWQFNSNFYADIPMQIPSGGAVLDERNGTQYWQFRNPLNSITGQGTGLAITTQFDINTANSNAVVQGPNRTGFYNLVNVLNGGSEFNYYPYGLPEYLTETYTYGEYNALNNYIGGINFLHYNLLNCRSNGDCYADWSQVTADAGELSAASEGTAQADHTVREDPNVFTGTVTGTPSTGATQVHVSATIGGGTQGGMYRWLVNQSSPLATGTKFTGTVSELTTGSAGNSAIMPPQVIDSTQNFPVSSMMQVCYAGSDNGATAATITQWQITSNVAIFTTNAQSPALTAGEQLLLTNFAGGGGAIFDNKFVTVLSTGLSTTQFEVNFTHGDIALQISLGTATGGPAGCQSGSQPVGYIPSQNYRLSITGGSITSGVGTFAIAPTAPQVTPLQLIAGQTLMLYNFSLTGNAPFLNQQIVTVLSSGLSATQFEANVTGPDTAAIGTGYSTYSPTGYNPAANVAVDIVPSYTTSGGTGGLPAGFCTPGTVQTTNPGASCYLPTTGVGCVADQVEIESVNYTYNTGTGLITLDNLQFPHLNGAIFSVGGLACKAIEDVSSQYTSGGTSGVIDEVYPVAGSLNATTVYYVPQRTNLGYASPPLGGSTDGGSANGGQNASQQTALCFSTAMSNFALNSGVVSFSMSNPAGTNSGAFPLYNNKTVTIAANGDTSYNGSYPITLISGNNFQYTPTSPTGSTPTSGTVSTCNANYNILDAARVLSVLNPSNNAVDGTFVLFPNVASFSGATVREPHFQQININGTHLTETQFQPKVWNGGPTDNFTYAGNISGPGWGVEINNASNTNVYLGGGGSLIPPTSQLTLLGTWSYNFLIGAPQDTIIAVNNWNLAGASSNLSTFGLIKFPPLPGGFAGYQIDTLCYNPYYNYANRGNALTTGEYIFGNTVGSGCGAGVANGKVVSTVRMGHLIADLDGSIPEITSNDVTVAAISNTIANSPYVIGSQSGSTCYNYQIVAHDKNNGSTVPPGIIGPGPCSVNNGQATLTTSNFNRVCAFLNPGVFSYDFLKEVGSVWESMATNVAVGNGASFGQVPNYTCWNDQGGSTSTYSYPSANTTGSVFANSVDTTFLTAITSVTAPSVFATNLTVGNCVQAGAGGLLVTTSTPCGSGGGGGMVYPPAGIGNSTGAAWGTSYQVGTAANDLIQLDGSGNMPAVNASAMTNYQYANLAGSGIVPLANGGTGTASPGLIQGTNITITGSWPNQTINATGSGSGGFPFTLGSTSIAASSVTTSVAGLTVNGVLLNSTGSTTLYLNQHGAYTSPAVVSSFAAPAGSWPSWLVPTVTNATSTPSLAVAASTIPVTAGGTGVTSATLTGGTGISVTGTWPNQTIAATNISALTAGYFPLGTTATSIATNSPMDYGVTSSGKITSTVNITAPSFGTSGSAPYLRTNTSSNSDLAGQLTLSGGTASYSFANGYATAPICTATDTTAKNATQAVVTTTTLTINGTSTDVIDYICVGRT